MTVVAGTGSLRKRVIERLATVPAWVGLLAVAVTVGFLAWWNPIESLNVDTIVYRRGAQVFLSGTDRLYEQPYGDLPFTYPPVAAMLFAPFALPVPLVSAGLTVTSTLAAWRITWLALDTLRPEESGAAHARVAALLMPLAMLAEPLYQTIAYGQINLVLAWLVAEDILRLRRGRFSGVLIGIATLVKLTPGVFFLVLLLRRDVPALVRGVATILVGVAVGFLAMPDSSRIFWSSLQGASDRVGDPGYFMNQSLKGALSRAGLTATPVWLIGVVLVVAISAWAIHVALRAGRDVPALLACAICGLLVSPVSWSHHWIWVWVILVWAFAGHDHRPGPRTVAVALAWALVVYAYPLGWAVPRDGTWPSGVPWWQMLVADLYVILGLGTTIMFGWRAARLRSGQRAAGVRAGDPPLGVRDERR